MQVVIHKRVACIAWMMMLSLHFGCGSADFAGSSAPAQKPPQSQDAKKPEPKPGPGGADGGVAKGEGVQWFFQCETDLVPTPTPVNPRDDLIEGAGDHYYPGANAAGLPVTFSGHICKPASLPRDIVFVIDTSGSMFANDFPRGGTCSRLEAIQSVINSITPGTAQFGIATFSSGLGRSSSGLSPDANTLFADVSGGGNIADVVCAYDGDTNYTAGMRRGGELLATGRPDATKEIYFISDGQPTQGNTGIAEAEQLKNVGVTIGQDTIKATIATVMLNGTDEVLEKSIASKDANGKPLHAYVGQAGNLAQTLTALSQNGFSKGQLKYRPLNPQQKDAKWEVIDITPSLKGLDFILPSIKIDREQAKEGLEVEVEYFDMHDNHYTIGGKLLWKDSVAAASGDTKKKPPK